MKDFYGTCFYKSTKLLSRNKIFLFVIIILDYSQVLFPSFDTCSNFIKYIQTNSNVNYSNYIISYSKYISMLSLTNLLSQCYKENTANDLRQCHLPPFLLYIICSFIVLFFIFLFCTRKNWINMKEESQKGNTAKIAIKSTKKYWNLFVIYFYNVVFFRILSSIIIDIIINFLINSIYSELKLLFFVLNLLLLVIYSYSAIAYFHYFHIYIKLDNEALNFPFDHFSQQFDIFSFIVKVLISFEHNLSLQFGTDHSLYLLDLPLFFEVTTIIVMISYTGKWLYEIFLLPNQLLYYTNPDMNQFRLFMNLFNTFALIVIVTCKNIQNYTIIIGLLLASVFLSIIIVRHCGLYRETKAIEGGNTILLMLFLIDYIWYGYTNADALNSNYKHEYSTKMKKIIISHFTLCKKIFNSCSFCKLFKSHPEIRNYAYDNHSCFFAILYETITADKKLIEENIEAYNILSFFHKSKLNINNPFNHSMSIIKAIKNKKHSQCFYLNMKIYYRNYIKIQKSIISRIESILFIDKKTNELYDFISKYENMLFYEERKPTKIIDGATYLYSLIKRVKKQLLNRLNSKNEYHSIIMQYIIESLTNAKLNFKDRILFDISLYEEFLSDHFEGDKNIVLDYVYNTKMALITLVGNDLIQYIKKPFSSIFHSSIRDHAMEHFNYCVTNTLTSNALVSKNLFSFPISTKDNQSSVMAFKLKYFLMPSIHLESSLITGIYQINLDDVIVAICDNKTKNEILLAYNKPLTRHLIIPNDFISHLNQFHSSINIKSIFTSISCSIVGNKDDVYSIDYNKYIPVAQSKLNLLLNDIKDPASQLKLPKIKDLTMYKSKVKRMHIKDRVEYQCSKLPYSCIVYLILNEDNTVILAKKDDFFSKFNVFEDNLFAAFQNTRTSSTTGNFLNSNSSVDVHNSNSTSNKYMSGLSLEVRQKLEEDVTRKKKELKKFKTLTHIIIIFNSILVIITITFLIVDIDAIIRFQDIFSFCLVWNRFIYLFFNTSISIFSNVCVALPETTNCLNNLDLFADDFNAISNLPSDFLIGSYLKYELTVKADLLQSSSKNVIQYIYNSIGKTAIDILEENYYYKYVTYEIDKLIVKSNVYSFLNGINVYINLINSIVNDLNYTILPLYIINIQGTTTSDIYLDNINVEGLTEIQIIEYNILINYPNFIGPFMKLNDIMSYQLRIHINDCFNIINIFFILLIVIHMVLFSICILFANFFKNVIEDYYNESLIKISLVPLMMGIKEKLAILKDILMYFKEDPNKKIEQYQALVNRFSFKGESNKASSIKTNPIIIKEKKKSKRVFTLFNGVIQEQTLVILFSSFGVYFIYSIIFYLLLYYSINDYNHLIRVVDFGSNLDIFLYSGIGIIQMMILTNQTDNEIGDYLGTKTGKGYVRKLMDNSYYYLNQLENDESDHQSLIPRLRDSIDLGCDTLFETLNDELLLITDKKYTERNYLAIMPKICHSFKIMEMKNDKLMINSIMLIVNKILLAIIHDIESLFGLKNSKELFDLNVMVLMLYRPIRIYQANTLNSQIIDKMTITYNTITYIYLLFNIAIEIFLFVLLKTFLIEKCIKIQKSMNMFVKCLKV